MSFEASILPSVAELLILPTANEPSGIFISPVLTSTSVPFIITSGDESLAGPLKYSEPLVPAPK